MSLRYEILKACASNPGAPIDEIADAIKHDRQKAAWAVRDCAKAGLLSMRRDDVTGQPGYTMTAEGKQRLAEGPGSKQGSNMKKVGSDSEGGETDVKAQSAEIPPQITPEIPPAEDGDDAMPPADASLLALANRELADRLARVAHVLRGSGLEGLKDLDDGADLQTAAAVLAGAYQMALAEPAMLRGELAKADADLGKIHTLLAHRVAGPNDPSDIGEVESAEKAADMIDEAVDEISRLSILLGEERAARQALQEETDELQREAMRGATCLSGQDRYTAAGYLVRASKRKPRTLLDKDKARDAALSSIRAGAKRAEVFALLPIGHARRGAAWWPA
ncbi:MAG: hypothetical protein ACRCTX_27095 [Afipia sp.]